MGFLFYSNLFPVLQFTTTITFLRLLPKVYILYVYVSENNATRTIDIHNLETTLISLNLICYCKEK